MERSIIEGYKKRARRPQKDRPCPARNERLTHSFYTLLDTTAKEKTPYELMNATEHVKKLASFAHETESFRQFVKNVSSHLENSGATKDPRHPLRFLVTGEPLALKNDIPLSRFEPEEGKVWPMTPALVKKAAPEKGEQAQDALVTLGNLFYAANEAGAPGVEELLTKATDKLMEDRQLHKYKSRQCQMD